MVQHKPRPEGEDEVPMPENIDDSLYNTLVYAAIWGIGASIEESSRHKFDKMFQELIIGEDVITSYEIDLGPDTMWEPMKIPNKINDCNSLFELFFDQDEMRW